MRILRLISVVGFALMLGACSCRTHRVGDDIPVANVGDILKDVHFAFDSYALDSGAKASLAESAKWLTDNSTVRTQIEGHCDERGTNEYNMVLGANRARAVQEYLRAQGIAADRMSTVSYGEEIPLDPAHNEAAWAKNRRAHFGVQK